MELDNIEEILPQRISKGDVIVFVDEVTGDLFSRRIIGITYEASNGRWVFAVESTLLAKLDGTHDRLGDITVTEDGRGYEKYTEEYSRPVRLLGRLSESTPLERVLAPGFRIRD
ncbi:MAG: hypothetical protein PHW75_02860 [Patescibacteria group bacterium]|nr:hypothetical protein [Patescibacteria group bacterium]